MMNLLLIKLILVELIHMQLGVVTILLMRIKHIQKTNKKATIQQVIIIVIREVMEAIMPKQAT